MDVSYDLEAHITSKCPTQLLKQFEKGFCALRNVHLQILKHTNLSFKTSHPDRIIFKSTSLTTSETGYYKVAELELRLILSNKVWEITHRVSVETDPFDLLGRWDIYANSSIVVPLDTNIPGTGKSQLVGLNTNGSPVTILEGTRRPNECQIQLENFTKKTLENHWLNMTRCALFIIKNNLGTASKCENCPDQLECLSWREKNRAS